MQTISLWERFTSAANNKTKVALPFGSAAFLFHIGGPTHVIARTACRPWQSVISGGRIPTSPSAPRNDGSERSAARGGKSDSREWPRWADEDGAFVADQDAGHRNRENDSAFCISEGLQHFELISHAPDGFHAPLLGHVLQFLTQTLYVHVHGAGVAEIVKAPDFVQQLVAGVDPVGRGC